MPPHKPEVVGQILSALAWRYLPSVVSKRIFSIEEMRDPMPTGASLSRSRKKVNPVLRQTPGRQASKSIAYSPEYARFVSYSRKLSPGKQVQNRRNGFLNTGADWIGRYGAASGQRESCRVSSSFAK